MKKSKRFILLIIGIVLVLVGYGAKVYNDLVRSEESVSAAWSQVANQYERRSDLIPNLVSTVKGYAEHEQQTLTRVIEARAKASQVQVQADDLTPEGVEQYLRAQEELTQSLSRLMVTVEAYPELKASDAFLVLQSQLEGTENRIAVERKRFIDQVKKYNSFRRRFPNNIYAKILGFDNRDYFTASDGAENAIQVDF